MATHADLDSTGLFDARYKAFLETLTQLRPRLHRYCARMTGSVLDGEDIVQEALFEAYRKLDTFDERRALVVTLPPKERACVLLKDVFDGEPVVIVEQRDDEHRWTPRTAVRLSASDGRVERIADYCFCPWILPAASVVITHA